MKKIYSKGLYLTNIAELVEYMPNVYHYRSKDLEQLICSNCQCSMSEHIQYHNGIGFKLICPNSNIIVDKQYNLIGIILNQNEFNKYFTQQNIIDDIIDDILVKYKTAKSIDVEDTIMQIMKNIFNTM